MEQHEAFSPVLIRVFDQASKVVGAGVVVADRQVLTFSHVVRRALDDDGGDLLGRTVNIDFAWPGQIGMVPARVAYIDQSRHTEATGNDDDDDDPLVCLLTDVPLTRGTAARFIDGGQNIDWVAYGFPAPEGATGAWARGAIVAPRPDGTLQLECTSDVGAEGGFSGAPLWCATAGGFVGLLRTARDGLKPKTAYAHPAKLVQGFLGRIGVRPPGQPGQYGGPLAVDDQRFLWREVDKAALATVSAAPFALVLRGASSSGKTSVLARVAREARHQGWAVVTLRLGSDFDTADLQDPVRFYQGFFRQCYGALGDEMRLDQHWRDEARNANGNRLMAQLLSARPERLVLLILDDLQAICAEPWANDFVGMLRGWHGRACNEPGWQRFALALAYSPDFDRDLLVKGSPLNHVTPLELRDLHRAEFEALHQCLAPPGRALDDGQLRRLFDLVGGHPYLVQAALHQVCVEGRPLDELHDRATLTDAESPFASHLRQLGRLLDRRPDLRDGLVQAARRACVRDYTVGQALLDSGLAREVPSAQQPTGWQERLCRGLWAGRRLRPRNALYGRFVLER
jgi:hypothetical protein